MSRWQCLNRPFIKCFDYTCWPVIPCLIGAANILWLRYWLNWMILWTWGIALLCGFGGQHSNMMPCYLIFKKKFLYLCHISVLITHHHCNRAQTNSLTDLFSKQEQEEVACFAGAVLFVLQEDFSFKVLWQMHWGHAASVWTLTVQWLAVSKCKSRRRGEYWTFIFTSLCSTISKTRQTS